LGQEGGLLLPSYAIVFLLLIANIMLRLTPKKDNTFNLGLRSNVDIVIYANTCVYAMW